MIGTSNPTLREDLFNQPTWEGARLDAATRPAVMTLNGTLMASGILLCLCAAAAVGTWGYLLNNPGLLMPLTFGGMIVGLILALVICFRPKTAPFIAPVYAIVEGVFVGGISLVYAAYAAGAKGTAGALGTNIVFQAALLTFGITAAMLIAYATRLIRPTQKVLAGISAATIGVMIFMVAGLVISLFSPGFMSSLWTGPLGIAIAGVIVVVAAANLVVDFAVVESGVENRAPKHMEWYAAFGLLVTLVWLYISLLRLLALLARRD